MIRPRFTLAAFLVAVLAGPARPQERPADIVGPAGYRQELTALAEGVWVLAQPRFHVQPAGNVTIVEQADGLVVVDAGGSPGAARRLVAQIRGLTRKPVKAVLITHWHGDHPQGLDVLLAAWPQARTISTAATRAHLADPKTMNTPGAFDAAADADLRKRIDGFADYCLEMAAKAATPEEKIGWEGSAALFRSYAEDMAGAVTLAPAEGFFDRLLIPDPERPVEVRFLGRANTDGDAVAWLPRQGVLVAGDVVVAPIPFGFGSYPGDWLQVLRQVRDLPFQVLVPGHGPPQRDRVYIDRLAGAIEEIRGKVAPLAAEELSLEDVRRRLNLSEQTRSFTGDDPWLRRWFAAYWITPIVASAYKEARGEPIAQSLQGQ